jgi:hypothetical protein
MKSRSGCRILRAGLLVTLCFEFLFVCKLPINAQKLPEGLSDQYSLASNPQTQPYNNYLPIISKSCDCYYIDSKSGSDSNSGIQPDKPWKTLSKLKTVNLQPGSIVYLKRGSIWTERLRLFTSGTSDKPITITAYGVGAVPILSNPGDTNIEGSVISLFGSYYIIKNVHIQESGFGIDIFSDHNVIQNNEINNVGIGVMLGGQYNLVTHNYIHDTYIVHTDPGGDDDWGADGVDIQGAHNEISFNRFINCEAFSYDYGMTGGALEIYNNGDYTSIHNNWSYQTESFIEISGNNPGSAQNVNISYNVIINATRFTVIHAIQIHNFRVENNTLIDLRPHNPILGRYIVFLGTPSPNTYILRNNIIYISDYYRVSTEAINCSGMLRAN